MKKLEIAGAWCKSAEEEGPFVVVNGGTHGNETPGIETVEELLDIVNETDLVRGRIVLSFGDLEAIKRGVRSVNPRDVNKCFAGPIPFVGGKPSSEWVRAQQLKGAWAGADIFWDLHATLKPSKAFLVVPNLADKSLASKVLPHFGIPTVITGQGLYPPSGEPIFADTFVDAMGGFGVTIEAGWANDPAVAALTGRVKAALIAVGVFPGEVVEPGVDLEMWDACQNVIAGGGFVFAKDWNNFDEVEAGTLIAHEDAGDVVAEHHSVLLFPKPQEKIVNGQEACILARRM